MSEQNNTESTETFTAIARDLIAEHPWFTGLTVGAVTMALSHFYYGNKLLTTTAWAFAALVGGVALSKIAEHAREIEVAAQAAIAMPSNVMAVAAMIEGKFTAMAKSNAELLEQLRVEKGRRDEEQKLLLQHANLTLAAVKAEAAEQARFRAWSADQTAEAKAFAAKAATDLEAALTAAKKLSAEPVIEPVATPAETPAEMPEEAGKKVVRKAKPAA